MPEVTLEGQKKLESCQSPLHRNGRAWVLLSRSTLPLPEWARSA